MTPSESNPGALSRVLSLAGALLVGYWVAREFSSIPAWGLTIAVVSLLSWIGFVLVPRQHSILSGTLIVVSALTGALAAGPTAGLLISPVIAAILTMISIADRPVWHGVALALGAAVLIPVGALEANVQVLGLLSMVGGIALAVIAGFSRRQVRVTQFQSMLLLEQRVAVQEEKARGAALAERQTVARDIHDVLAHSLGGLVLQLDAVEALLEAGRLDDATVRVTHAREMAASGLAEARRAIDALRDDRRGHLVMSDEFLRSIDELVLAHRSLGGSIDFDTEGAGRDLDYDTAEALRRTLQEALTNARKHAPGAPVSVRLAFRNGHVDLDVRNPVNGPAVSAPGGGHGLLGMHERAAALAGSTVQAALVHGQFVVHTSLVTA